MQMYMNQSMESFENWRDSQHDRPEPDTDTPDEQIVRSYTFDDCYDKEAQRAHSREQKAAHSTPVPTIKPKKHEMER